MSSYHSLSYSINPPHFMQPEVHYSVHKRIPLATSLIQMNPVHTIPSSLFKIPFNVILQSSPTSPKLPLISGHTTKTLYAYFCPSIDPNTRLRGFRLPAAVQLRTSLFWDVLKRRLVLSYGRVGATYLPQFQEQSGPHPSLLCWFQG